MSAGQMPMGGPPPGAMPGIGAGMPMGPQAAPPGQIGPPGLAPGPMPPMGGMVPPPSTYTDLPARMHAGWQLLDMAIRTAQTALDTGEFRSTPNVAAVIRSVIGTMTKLLSAYSSGSPSTSGAPAESERGALAAGGTPPTAIHGDPVVAEPPQD